MNTLQDKDQFDELKQVFDNFNPSDRNYDFIQKLERNLDSVELVKRQIGFFIKRNRKMTCYAAFAGFFAGLVALWVLPIIVNMFLLYINSVTYPVFSISLTEPWILEVKTILCLALSAGTTFFVSLKTYNFLSYYSRNPSPF